MGLIILFFLWVLYDGMKHIICIIHTQILTALRYVGLKSFYLSNFNIFSSSPFIGVCGCFSWVFIGFGRFRYIIDLMRVLLSINLSFFLFAWLSFYQTRVLFWGFFKIFFLLGVQLTKVWSQIFTIKFLTAVLPVASDFLLFIVLNLFINRSNILPIADKGVLINGNIILILHWSFRNVLIVSINILWVGWSLLMMSPCSMTILLN